VTNRPGLYQRGAPGPEPPSGRLATSTGRLHAARLARRRRVDV
jgi:hypothetical protein